MRRACAVVGQSRAGWYYRARGRPENVALTQRMTEIARTRVRYGMWRIFVLLRREGWQVNHKRVHRLYRLAGLSLRCRRPHRRKAAAHRLARTPLTAPNQSWSMDFVTDTLFNGQRFRALTVVDNFTRECLAIRSGQSLKATDVLDTLSALVAARGPPARIQADNGPEFVALVVDQWACAHGVTLDYSRPGKPTDNAYVESFNGSLRDECLNTTWFLSLQQAAETLESWRRDYNEFRPHSALADRPPAQFAARFSKPSHRPISRL